MIPPDVWRANVHSVVQMLANEEFQQKAWLEKSPENVFSPDELVSGFFDDLFFDEFLASKEVNLNVQCRRAGQELQAELDEFCKSTPSHLDAAVIFHDPRWQKIRELAALFLCCF